MLMQDSLTGYLHEVPELGEPEPYGEVAYDGFGNPVGFFGRRRRRRRAPETEQPTVQPPPPPPAPMPMEHGPAPQAPPEGGGEHMPGDEIGEATYDGLGNPVGWNPFRSVRGAFRRVGSLIPRPFRPFVAAAALPFTAAALPFAAAALLQRLRA